MSKSLNVSLRRKTFYIDYKSDNCSNDRMRNFHLHSDYEIFYLIEGERKYIINGKQYLVKENSLVFIDKNIVHKTEMTEKPHFQRVVINFQDVFLSSEDHFLLSELFENGPYIISLSQSKKYTISELINKMRHEYTNDDERAIVYIRTLLTQLLIESTRLLKDQKNIGIAKHDNETNKQEVGKFIEYINNNFASDISLNRLSQHFHLNEQYISRLFKEVTGSNVINYLNAVRVNEAQRLLLESSMKVNEISKSVGYSNHVHFWRVFKKLTGTSPSEYRSVYNRM